MWCCFAIFLYYIFQCASISLTSAYLLITICQGLIICYFQWMSGISRIETPFLDIPGGCSTKSSKLRCFVIRSLIGTIAFSFMFHCMNLVGCIFWIRRFRLVPFLIMYCMCSPVATEGLWWAQAAKYSSKPHKLKYETL